MVHHAAFSLSSPPLSAQEFVSLGCPAIAQPSLAGCLSKAIEIIGTKVTFTSVDTPTFLFLHASQENPTPGQKSPKKK